jgi:large subunit ribosomal protein L18
MRHKRRVRHGHSGTAERPRLTVFFSNKHVYAQVIDDLKGATVCSCGTLSKDLKGQVQGKPQSEAAAIVGKTIGEMAKQAGVEKVIFDRSGYQYGKRLKALADAARKSGLDF